MTKFIDTKVDINKIDINPANIPPDDPKFLPLYMKAMKGDLEVCVAMIKAEGVKPFSPHFRPQLTDEDRERYQSFIDQGKAHLLHVYKDNDIFIMSDDYFAYTYYKEINLPTLPCFILGESESEFIVNKVEGYYIDKD